MFFVDAKREETVAALKELRRCDYGLDHGVAEFRPMAAVVVRALGNRWREMSVEERAPYEEQAAAAATAAAAVAEDRELIVDERDDHTWRATAPGDSESGAQASLSLSLMAGTGMNTGTGTGTAAAAPPAVTYPKAPKGNGILTVRFRPKSTAAAVAAAAAACAGRGAPAPSAPPAPSAEVDQLDQFDQLDQPFDQLSSWIEVERERERERESRCDRATSR